MKFHKIQINGNDFIVLREVVGLKNDDLRQLALKLCDTHYGVGGDGVVYLYTSNYQYYVRFFNYNGKELMLLGHGLATIAHLLNIEEIISSKISLNTMCGERHLKIIETGIELDYGVPRNINKFRLEYFKDVTYYLVDHGVIHFVMLVDDINQINFNELQSKIKQKNIDMTVFSVTKVHETINVRTYMHGVGELYSSGEGAASAFYVYHKFYNGPRKLIVHYLGGDSIVEEGGYGEIRLLINPKLVFKGDIELKI